MGTTGATVDPNTTSRCYLFFRLKKGSLRRLVTVNFVLAYSLFLLIMFGLCVGIFVGTNAAVRSSAESGLANRAGANSARTLAARSQWISDLFVIHQNGFVNPTLEVMSDTFRSGPGYSLGPLSGPYFDWSDATLAQPLSTDARQIQNVSFSRTSYYVPGSNLSTVFTPSVISVRDKSVHMDSLYRKTYLTYSAFVQAYTGFDDGGLFITYPGQSSTASDPLRSYDPRVRPWYVASKAVPGQAVVTNPYRDFHGRGWMVTLCKTLARISDGLIIGVAGGDMLLTTIRARIESIKFLTSGKVSLFTQSGLVVADPEWVDDTVGLLAGRV